MKDKRRLTEGFKSLLIVLLTLSALYLLYLSPLLRGSPLADLLADDDAPKASTGAALSVSVTPARMVVSNGVIRSGIQYDPQEVDRLFEQTAPLLGEALRTASSPTAVTEAEWQSLLSGAGLYFDFLTPLPLSALCGWLQSAGDNPALTHSARHLLLAPRWDGSVVLGYQGSGGGCFLSVTGLSAQLHLAPITEAITPNGAYFAYEDETLAPVLTPLTLFSGTEPDFPIFSIASPDLSPGSGAADQLLSSLSFGEQNSAPISGGWVYADGEDTLRLYGDGQVIYHAAQPGKYPCAGTGLSAALDAAWALAEGALTPLSGSGRLYLTEAQTVAPDCYQISFGYLLNGCPVQLHQDGWAAQFTVEEGAVTAFTLRPRIYTDAGQTALLLPQEKAAAALSTLTDHPCELLIQYSDDGSAAASPHWVGK